MSQSAPRRAEKIPNPRRLAAIRAVYCVWGPGALPWLGRETAYSVQAAGSGGEETHVHAPEARRARGGPFGPQ